MGRHRIPGLTKRAKIYPDVFAASSIADLLDTNTNRDYVKTKLHLIKKGISIIDEALCGHSFIFDQESHCNHNGISKCVNKYTIYSDSIKTIFGLKEDKEIKNSLIKIRENLEEIIRDPINASVENYSKPLEIFAYVSDSLNAKLRGIPALP